MSTNNQAYRKILIYSLVAVAMLFALAEIKLPLPEGEKGIRELEAKIESCEIDHLGKSSSENYYIHIHLSNSNPKKISHNFTGSEKPFYVRVCGKKSEVNIKYYAVRTLLRPKISYWLTELNEK
jgi:hypothetical protein